MKHNQHGKKPHHNFPSPEFWDALAKVAGVVAAGLEIAKIFMTTGSGS